MSDFLNPHLTRPAVRWTSGDALPAIEQTGPAAPLLVDATTGRLMVDTEANLTADLSDIEGKQDVTNALLTTTAADIAAVKTQLATGSVAVTGGGGGGGSSAQYNATLPTYTSGASSTLQTDANGRLITVDNNSPSQVYNYTITGALAAGTVIIGPIDCSQFREVSVQVVSVGTGGTAPFLQISNDGTNWLNISVVNTNGAIASTMGSGAISVASLFNAKQFRILSAGTQTSGTTTLVAYASQQATTKLYQTVTISGAPAVISTPNATSNTGGFSLYHTLISAATTNATSVKASNGIIGTCVLTNTSTTFKYVKFFNLAVAPTMGTSTPVLNLPIAPNSTLDVSTAFAGLRLATGISYAITGGSALLDNTAVGAGEVLVNLSYV
jgi:hypothetical protein